MKRVDQLKEDTWNLEIVFKNENEIKEYTRIIEEKANDFDEKKDNFFQSSEHLLDSIQQYHTIYRNIEKVYAYSHHKLDEDLSNQEAQKVNNEVFEMIVKVDTKLSFYIPLLLQNIEKVRDMMIEEKFAQYQNFLKDLIRQQEYIKSKEIEKILSNAGEVLSAPSKIYSKLINVDLKFPNVNDSEGNENKLDNALYGKHMQSQDRVLRKNSFDAMYDTLAMFNETLSEIYISEVKKDIFLKDTKGYKTLRHKALFNTQIPEQVYDNLIQEVNNSLKYHDEYLQIRFDKMNNKELKMYDLYPTLHDEIDATYTFEQAKEIVLKALKPLGHEYVKTVENFFENRYIDVYPNESKRSGAYSGGSYDTPPYILLNYTNTLNDVYTLIHEIGHSMHTHYSNTTQTYQDASYKIFIAEIASTLNELLLTKYLFENASSDEEKLYILNYKLEQYKGTVFRQTMFAEFEHLSKLEIENGSINSSMLNEMYLNLCNKYFANVVTVDEKIKYEWTRIPHFYYNYYVYQYATSFCASINIFDNLEKDNSYVDKYIGFLKLGASKSSLEALQTINIDFAHDNIIEQSMKDFEETLRLYKSISDKKNK